MTAASLRHALCLGDHALGILSNDIPESAPDEVRAWGYADDEEAFTNILIFTDGSGTMTNTLPQNIYAELIPAKKNCSYIKNNSEKSKL